MDGNETSIIGEEDDLRSFLDRGGQASHIRRSGYEGITTKMLEDISNHFGKTGEDSPAEGGGDRGHSGFSNRLEKPLLLDPRRSTGDLPEGPASCDLEHPVIVFQTLGQSYEIAGLESRHLSLTSMDRVLDLRRPTAGKPP